MVVDVTVAAAAGNQQGGGGKAAAPARLEAVVVVAVEGMVFASPGRKSAEDHLPADNEVRRNIGFVEQVYALYKQYIYADTRMRSYFKLHIRLKIPPTLFGFYLSACAPGTTLCPGHIVPHPFSAWFSPPTSEGDCASVLGDAACIELDDAACIGLVGSPPLISKRKVTGVGATSFRAIPCTTVLTLPGEISSAAGSACSSRSQRTDMIKSASGTAVAFT